MAYEDVYCKNCDRYLGRRPITVFGIDPGFNDSKGKAYDPDCQECNPFYYEKCSKCNRNVIDQNGKCKSCGTVNTID